MGALPTIVVQNRRWTRIANAEELAQWRQGVGGSVALREPASYPVLVALTIDAREEHGPDFLHPHDLYQLATFLDGAFESRADA